MRMRKIMDARRRQLIFMYFSDASVLVGISIIISVLIIGCLLRWFRDLVGAVLINNISVNNLIPGIALLFLLITLITGLTTSWISSHISPMDTL
jgi:hypothetical protein